MAAAKSSLAAPHGLLFDFAGGQDLKFFKIVPEFVGVVNLGGLLWMLCDCSAAVIPPHINSVDRWSDPTRL